MVLTIRTGRLSFIPFLSPCFHSFFFSILTETLCFFASFLPSLFLSTFFSFPSLPFFSYCPTSCPSFSTPFLLSSLFSVFFLASFPPSSPINFTYFLSSCLLPPSCFSLFVSAFIPSCHLSSFFLTPLLVFLLSSPPSLGLFFSLALPSFVSPFCLSLNPLLSFLFVTFTVPPLRSCFFPPCLPHVLMSPFPRPRSSSTFPPAFIPSFSLMWNPLQMIRCRIHVSTASRPSGRPVTLRD